MPQQRSTLGQEILLHNQIIQDSRFAEDHLQLESDYSSCYVEQCLSKKIHSNSLNDTNPLSFRKSSNALLYIIIEYSLGRHSFLSFLNGFSNEDSRPHLNVVCVHFDYGEI